MGHGTSKSYFTKYANTKVLVHNPFPIPGDIFGKGILQLTFYNTVNAKAVQKIVIQIIGTGWKKHIWLQQIIWQYI